MAKATGPDDIPIEAQKCLGEVGEIWLTRLFNKVLMTKKMPDEWRSVIAPIYKNMEIYKLVQTIMRLNV